MGGWRRSTSSPHALHILSSASEPQATLELAMGCRAAFVATVRFTSLPSTRAWVALGSSTLASGQGKARERR